MDFFVVLCISANNIYICSSPINNFVMAGQKDGFSGEKAYVLPPACIADMERDPAGSLLHFTDIGYYPAAYNHYRKRVEPIGQWVLIYCRAGKGWYSVGGQRYEVTPNSYFVLPAGMPHEYGADSSDPWTIYWVHYRGSMAEVMMPPTHGPVAVRPGESSRIADRLNLFEEIMAMLECGYSHDSLIFACATLSYFLSTLRHIDSYRAARMSQYTENEMDNAGITDAVIRYMSENLERNLRLADLAEYVGVTPTYLSHLFTLRTGNSPMTHLRQLRMSHACHLLDFSTLHINQICHKVGISDPYYFSRVFTATMGISPSDYRRQPKG